MIGLLVLLGAVALALSYAALTGVGGNGDESLPTRTGAPTSLPGPTIEEPDGDDGPDESDDPTEQAAPFGLVTPSRVMLAVSETVLARAGTGTCDAPGRFEISEDAGATWTASEAFGESGATRVMRLITDGPSAMLVVAGDADCDPHLFRTEMPDDTWRSAGSPSSAWYLDPAATREIGTPDGVRDAPCDALSLAAAGSRAALLCDDASVIVTADRGATWSDPVEVPTAVAINIVADLGFVLALAGDGDCQGIGLAMLGDDGLAAAGECLEVDLTEVTAGEIAVARTGEESFVWIGDTFARHTSGVPGWVTG